MLYLLGFSAMLAAAAPASAQDLRCDDRKTLNIGVILPFSQRDAIYGIPNWLGILAAVDSHRLLKEGCRIRLSVYDDAGDPAAAERAAKALLEEKPAAILGSADSATTERIIDAVGDHVLVISGQASQTNLTVADPACAKARMTCPVPKPLFFRTSLTNERLAGILYDDYLRKRVLAAAVSQESNGIYVVYNAGSQYSRDLADALRRLDQNVALERYGAPGSNNGIDSVLKKLADDGPLKTLVVLTPDDRETAEIVRKVRKMQGWFGPFQQLQDIIVIEVHPAIFDTATFDSVTMLTSYSPKSKARVGTERLRQDYKIAYKTLKGCYSAKDSSPCNFDAVDAGAPLLTAVMHRSVSSSGTAPSWGFEAEPPSDFKKLSEAFSVQIGTADVNEEYASNKAPTYASALGYDQASILLDAVVRVMASPAAPSFWAGGKDASRSLKEALETGTYDGALGTYSFNEKNHSGTFAPERWKREHVPSWDTELPQEGRWRDHLKLSLAIGYNRQNGAADTTEIKWKPKVSFPVKLTDDFLWGKLSWEPDVYYQDQFEKQTGAGTRTRMVACDPLVLSLEYPLWKPYAGIGAGQAYTVSSSGHASPVVASFTVGADFPLSAWTKMLALNVEWQRQSKFRGTGPTVSNTMSVSFKLSYPPSQDD